VSVFLSRGHFILISSYDKFTEF